MERRKLFTIDKSPLNITLQKFVMLKKSKEKNELLRKIKS